MIRAPISLSADREMQALLRVCAAGLARSAIAPADLEGIDWQRLAALADRHRLVPVIWHVLRRQVSFPLPEGVGNELQDKHQRNALHALKAAAHLVKITEALRAAGIPALPLKGVCLAEVYYQDIAARHAGDVDLLVSPEHLDRADEVLRGLGYLRMSNKTRTMMREPVDEELYFRLHYLYFSKDGVHLELHFQLHFNPAVLPIKVEEIVKRGASVTIGKTTLPVMPDALQFVFLATHGARHEWERLQWVYDIAVMVDRASETELREWLELARSLKFANPAVQALVLAERTFGVSLPQEVTNKYRRSLRIGFMVRRAERTMLRQAPPPPIQPGRRLYRVCATSEPSYLWNEFRNALKALSARVASLRGSGQ